MFSGIVEEVGSIDSIQRVPSGLKLHIRCKKILDDLKLGDSVAVNGVCLTAVEINDDSFVADVSFETLSKSNLGDLKIKEFVNLERALKVSDRLSGHIVLGHIDSKCIISKIQRSGDFYILGISIDNYVYRYCIKKGSVCIDGISLTINELDNTYLELTIIPHTFENTNLRYKKVGNYVNIEVDVLGKYVEKMLKLGSSIDENFLKENGFV